MPSFHFIKFGLLCPVLLIFCSGTASAQNLTNDARCFLLSTAFSKSADNEKAKQAAMQSSFFYLGRLNGSASQVNAAIASQITKLNTKEAGAIMQTCAREVAAKADEIQAIGARLNSTKPK